MPPKRQVPTPHVPSAEQRRAGFEQLQRLKTNGEKLLGQPAISDEKFDAWRVSVGLCLESIFGEECPHVLPCSTTIPMRTGHTDEARFAAMRVGLSKRTVSMIEAILEQHMHELSAPPAPTPMPVATDRLDLFVSHASVDEDLAEAFYNLVRAAMNIDHRRVRCTSVKACKLEGGLPFEEALRIETLQSTVFVPLVTPSVLKSMFTVFEIGARWGSQRRLIPIRARGADYTSIGRPLNSLHLCNGAERSEMMQAMETLAELLQRPLSSGVAWEKELSTFLKLAAVDPAKQEAPPATKETPKFFGDQGVLWAKGSVPGMYKAHCPTCEKPMAWLVEGYQCRPCGAWFHGISQSPMAVPDEFKS